ncbi:unnamed protein product [Orchesella dallaii]|uniref:F-box domain-containing protein n=1 Tax=Orchesella dallaii TaxID=48710 RepID=A0ABP1RUB2_9HEXA
MERSSTSSSFTTDLASDHPFDNNKNPMLNRVVLKNLFGLIPFKLEEFKNFRLVSHEWNDCAVKYMHQNTWLKLNKRDETHTTLMDSISFCLQKSHQLNPFLKGTLGFKKYLISMQTLGSMNTYSFLFNFWEKFGVRMTHLEISYTQMYPKDLVRIMLELTPNLQVFIFKSNHIYDTTPISSNARNGLVWDEGFRPQESSINKNLTHLTITNVDIEHDGLPFNWIDMICHFPNMKNLKLGLEHTSSRLALSSLEEFLQAVILVRQNCGQHYLAQLEHLDIMEIPEYMYLKRLPGNILLLLRKLAFPLSTLTLDIGTRHNGGDRLALKNTLELHSASLQNLTLYQGHWIEPSSFHT